MTTDLDESDSSPHYSLPLDRRYPELNLVLRMAQCDDIDAFVRAYKATCWLSAQDEDHAQLANGKGFSKSDTKLGNKLAKCRMERVVRNPFTAMLAVDLARKYRRQLPSALRVDKPKQAKMQF